MKPTISVIVPIYKTEQYLPMCIESILTQTFTDFELILVNDGSPDNSAQICMRYQEKDPRIKILSKENGGISSARNAGLEIAGGDYLVFVDSDDYIEADFLEKAYTTMIAANVELYIGGFCEVHEANGRKVPRCLETAKQYSVAELLNRYEIDYPAYWLSLVWGKLYKTEIIRDRGIRFDTRLSYKEDALFVYSYLRFVDQIYFDSQAIYNYRMLRSGSLNLKIYQNMYDINHRVYTQKRNLMMERNCPSKVYNHIYFGSLLRSIEYFYMSDHPDCMANRRKTIDAVCGNETLTQISLQDISGIKRKLMFVLCKIRAKRTIATLFWLQSRIRG